MKKQLSFILAVLICITSVMLAFSWLFQPKEKTQAASGLIFNEAELLNKVEIVNPNDMDASFLMDMVENQNPFDITTKAMMTGYSVVPKTINTMKDVNSSYVVDSFSVVPGESIYMWIFIPNEYLHDLTVAFEDGSSRISWTLAKSDLTSILDDAKRGSYIYGWRLFEFCLSDAEMTNEVRDNISSFHFNTLKISYINNTGLLVESNKNKFSFYHVFLASSFSSYTKVVDAQNYVQYKLNDEFNGEDNYFIDDEILFGNVKSLFSVLIVGQVNLKDYSNSNYSFQLSVQDPSGDVFDKYFGEKFIFEKVGYHRISVTIKEFRADSSKVVLFEQIDFYVDYFAIGSFTNVNYKFEKGETTAITFKFSKAFTITGDIEIGVSDKKLAEVTHYIEDGTCYIQVKALEEGEFKLIVKAKGERAGSGNVKNYSLSTAAEVIDLNKKSGSEIFLWVVLVLYGVGFTTFLVISLVKARRVSVK